MTKASIQIRGLREPRPEYFFGLMSLGLPNYKTVGPALGCGSGVGVLRVFAMHRERFELFHLATFFMN
jgi:hypothetical protein